jgi:hypothetical protein
MGSGDSPLPNIREQGYQLAFKLACQQLAGMGVEEVCRNAAVKCQDSDKILLEHLNQLYLVVLTDCKISPLGREEEIPLWDKVLMLHYLTSAKGSIATNKLITFQQLPGCASYYTVFYQRAIKPLLDRFGKEPELLIDAGAKLGARKGGCGDVSITVRAFPRVPVTVTLWRGDQEFTPRGSIMFDSTISDYLPTEDIRDLCAGITRRLIKNLS